MNTRRGIVRNFALLIPTLAVSVPAHGQTSSTNTKLGTDALKANLSGEYNTALGANALITNETGSHNTATGRRALYRNLMGSNNVALGSYALEQNGANVTTAVNNNNTGVGFQALRYNVSGTGNTAVGAKALLSADTSNNTAVGYGALLYAAGSSNTAVGVDAGPCMACNFTTTMGHNAFANSNATALGYSAQAGADAAAIGISAIAGSFAVAVGANAQASGSNSTAVGYRAFAGALNSTALGNNTQVTASNTIRLGNGAVTAIGGIVNFNATSDGRYKTNVKENVPGLEFISKLKPVTFKWDLGKLNKLDGLEELASDPVLGGAREAKAKKVYTGFIAQDVEAAAMECGYDFSGVHKPANEQSEYSLAYAEFVVPLVKAVQEQQKEIEELQKTVRALATDSRLPSGRLGAATAPETSQHAGVLGNFWGGAMTLLSAALVLMHLKRRRESAPAR